MEGSPRITLRRAEPDDYALVCEVFNDESAYSGTLQLPYPSRELWRKRLTEPAEGHYLFVALSGDEIVGNAGLHPQGNSPRRAHAMMVGMAVPSAWQGRGVGTALLRAMCELADGWLNVIRLELTVFTDNERAIGLYRKFGFEVEGTHRAYALRAGRYVDAHCMARIRAKQTGDRPHVPNEGT